MMFSFPASFARTAILAVLAATFAICLADIVPAHGAPFGALQPASAATSGSGLVGWIFAEQAAFYRSLSSYIRASKDDGAAMWALFGISFLYGIFHAVGPGHGKAVISSYLVANEETWRRGLVLSFISAAIQSVVAVVIVLISAVLLEATAKTIGWTVHIVEIVSYALIILIGLRSLFVKGRSFLIAIRRFEWPVRLLEAAPASVGIAPVFQRHSTGKIGCSHCDAGHGFHCDGDHDHHASAWSHAHAPEPAGLGGAKGWRRGLSAVMAVGLRPCSGAIIVLIFALAQDLFWTGVGATLLMGLGTALTVAVIATLAVGARHVASRIASAQSGWGTLAMRAVEVGASALMMAFGVLLLAGYMASEQLWMFTG